MLSCINLSIKFMTKNNENKLKNDEAIDVLVIFTTVSIRAKERGLYNDDIICLLVRHPLILAPNAYWNFRFGRLEIINVLMTFNHSKEGWMAHKMGKFGFVASFWQNFHYNSWSNLWISLQSKKKVLWWNEKLQYFCYWRIWLDLILDRQKIKTAFFKTEDKKGTVK